jgi:hypothetical protein
LRGGFGYALLPVALALAAPAFAQSKGDVMLAAALKGRTPGDPVDCITLHRIRSVQVIDGIGILYGMLDGTLYLNRPRFGGSRLDSSDIVVADTHTPQLCSIDSVRLKDDLDGHLRAVVGLGKFQPWRKQAP